ncbi:MAG: helix-hairpin-helix domain-containing protein [Pedobacter sp.]
MRKWLNNYFDFTKSEFNGLLVLVVLIALVTAAPYAYALVDKEEYNAEDDLLVKRLILLDAKEGSADKITYKSNKTTAKYSPVKHKGSFFKFDPNLIGLADWMRLGLSEKQAAAVVRYVAKGGRFRQPDDLKKMYTISPQKYLEMSPYVVITVPAEPEKQRATQEKLTLTTAPTTATAGSLNSRFTTSYPKKQTVIVEINGADSAGLDEIRGFGPAFALRILNYRERIGGFVNKEQLMEVFGLDSLKFAEIKSQISVDASSIRKININSVTADNLKNHPYLRFKQLNAIVQYRKQHGNYTTVADLAKVLVLPAETIARLTPYLTF